jgi:large repetitive protein
MNIITIAMHIVKRIILLFAITILIVSMSGSVMAANISGYKFSGTNATNGTGLPGWTITLENRFVSLTCTTDPSGYFEFSNVAFGFYELNETLQPGWIQITPNRAVQVNATVQDLYNQNFANLQLPQGSVAGFKRNQTGAGLSGWTISLTNNSLGGTRNTVTNASGFFQFTGLPLGIYELNETLLPGWSQITPDRLVEINLSTPDIVDQDFINTPQLGNISGYKHNETGAGLSGWNIRLFDQSSGTLVAQTSTGADGGFGFSGLPWGTYLVNETLQPGWTLVNPAGGNYSVTIDGTNLDVVNRNFTNMQFGSISGYKRDQAGGQGLSGWTIRIYNHSSGTLVAQAVTGSDGGFSFSGLPWGTYLVNETLQPGWTLVSPAGGNYTLIINDTNLNSINKNFTNLQIPGSISGYKLNHTGGQGLSGWTIRIYNQSSGTLVAQAVTGSDGGFSFSGLPWGTYIVNETLQPGWTLVNPAGGNHTVTITGTILNVSNRNFTNMQQIGSISGYKRDESGNGLSGWTITIANRLRGTTTTLTDGSGFFRFDNVPFDIYILNETLQPGWIQLTPNRAVEIDAATPHLFNQNFTNRLLLGTVSGYKRDQTGTGLSGWTISLSNTTRGITRTASTNDTGFFLFDSLPLGIYQLNETVQPGWVQLTPDRTIEINITVPDLVNQNFINSPSNGSISGYKLNQTGGQGLSGWTIRIYNQSSGTLVSQAVTGSDGGFSFSSLPWGTYLVNETLQPGWTLVNPAGGNYSIIINGTNLNVPNRNFSNLQQPGAISGYKLNQTGGQGLSGWTIRIYNQSSGVLVAQAVTGLEGGFNFSSLPWGTYLVNETLQPGWTLVSPAGGNYSIIINGTNLNVVNRNFSNLQQPGSISGYKFNQSSGLGLGGWEMNLFNQSGAEIASTMTNSSGGFSFSNLAWGTYILNETQQPGWNLVYPSEGRYIITIDGTNLNVANRIFINHQQLGNISGYKRDQETGSGLPGWNITLYGASGGTLLARSETDANGFYSFINLLPGEYTVNETLKEGYIIISPPGGSYNIILDVNNLSIQNVNFTNAAIPPEKSQICGWVGSDSNQGAAYVSGIRVRFALNASDLMIPGKYYETTTDSRGVYCIAELPADTALYGIALSPLYAPGSYLERPISYQVNGNPLVICNDASCTPVIRSPNVNETLQMNWILTRNPGNINSIIPYAFL